MSTLVQAERLESLIDVPKDAELFDRTVPRWLVHRAAVSEVLLTGMRPRGRDAYRVGAQWPRYHSYYGPVAGRWHDPMLFAESVRQTALLLGHQALGIPLGHQFLTRTMTFEILQEGLRIDSAPAHVVLDVTMRDIRCRGGHVASFGCDFTAYRDGRPIGRAGGTTDCVAPAVYRRLRGGRTEAIPPGPLIQAIEPRLVGRLREFDVVLGVPDGEADHAPGRVHLLRADSSHPVLFDHPVDHVPGMLVLEAARQAALAALGLPRGLPVGCEAEFLRYIELDSPCLVRTSPPAVDASGQRRLTVTFHQGGALAGTCGITLVETPGEDARF